MSKGNNFKGMFGIGREAESETPGVETAFAEDFEAEESEIRDIPTGDYYEAFPMRSSQDKQYPATFIAPGAVFEGAIHSKGDIDVGGDVIGDIVSEGSVIIRSNIDGNITAANLNLIGCRMRGDVAVAHSLFLNEGSSIEGNVQAEDVISSGVVQGTILVSNNITLDERARVIGDIKTRTMTMARGAVIRGQIEMNEKE